MVELENVLEGDRIYLRELRVDDVNDAYCRWMNDPAVNQFLESRFSSHTVESLKEYVRVRQGDGKHAFFAMLLKDGRRHIGNIKLGPIDSNHRLADIGILMGEKDCWGKGYATEAIRLTADYAFEKLNLHKVTAGCYALNKGSIKAFLKAGFIQEGVRKEHCLYDGKFVDVVLLGFLKT